jgi:hypothetical protein
MAHAENHRAEELVTLLAEQLARQLAETLAPLIDQLVDAEKPAASSQPGLEQQPGTEGLWTVRQVATHYNVTQTFIYQHADELGCVRLGGGSRARLRFDPHIVRERWPHLGDPLPPVAPQRLAPRHPRRRSTVPLLEFDRDP